MLNPAPLALAALLSLLALVALPRAAANADKIIVSPPTPPLVLQTSPVAGDDPATAWFHVADLASTVEIRVNWPATVCPSSAAGWASGPQSPADVALAGPH
nr:hypothetical protein HK105_002302 [Polyrhizophydium stewartii]